MAMPDKSNLRILVPTAGPTPAKEKAEYILKLAQRLQAEVMVLNIVRSFYDEKKCEFGKEALNIFEETGKQYNVKVETFLREGELLDTLVKFAEEKKPDLIIMGASEDGRMIADWIVSDLRYRKDLPIVIEPHGLGTIPEEL